MKTVIITDTNSARDALAQGEREEVVIMRDGHPVALITPLGEDDLQWLQLERDPAFVESISQARQQIAGGKSVSHGDLKKELGL
jgi:PHD/YefM family antitoxin component YafN of YafNO toxin-antitoxin module